MKPKSLELYRLAIQKFSRTSKEPFEQIYLDKTKVHEVLFSLSKSMNASSWNTYLVLYKRYAKWLSDPEDEITPKLWRKIKKKPIDWKEKLENKYLTKKVDIIIFKGPMVGYQLKGTFVGFQTSGPIFDSFSEKVMNAMKLQIKSVGIIKVDEVFEASSGKDSKKLA